MNDGYEPVYGAIIIPAGRYRVTKILDTFVIAEPVA